MLDKYMIQLLIFLSLNVFFLFWMQHIFVEIPVSVPVIEKAALSEVRGGWTLHPFMVWKTFSCLDCIPQPWTVPPLFVWGRRKLILLHQAAHCVWVFYNSLFEKSNVSNYRALICTAPKCQGPDANSPPLIFSGWCSKFRKRLVRGR